MKHRIKITMVAEYTLDTDLYPPNLTLREMMQIDEDNEIHESLELLSVEYEETNET